MENGKHSSEDDSSQQRKRRRMGITPSITTATSKSTESKEACGILKKVSLKNFMCHDSLECNLFSYVNLIQGRNGSGKSAILTAIVVALGGTTKITNRGNSMKELVQYNKNAATVEVQLNNSGINSYKPDEYGDTIIIQRKISNSASNYTIKSAKGKIISNKKQELVNILDAFNIQVDNPVTVLNQDSSRSFLKSSNPKDLFKFFMLVTQLQQIKDIYTESDNSLATSMSIVKNRSESLPLLEKEMEDAKRKYEIISTFGEKKKKLTELRIELAWCEIITLEKDLENRRGKDDKFSRGLSKLNKERETVQEKITKEEKNLKELESSIEEDGNKFAKQSSIVDELVKSKQQINKDNRILLEQKKALEKECNRISAEKKSLESAINTDDNRDQYEALVRENEEAIRGTEDQINALKEELETVQTHANNLNHTVSNVKHDLQQYNLEEKQFNSMCNDVDRELKQLKGNNDPHMVYGHWVKPVLSAIEQKWQQRKFKEKPVGPLGLYIQVKDPKWAHIAEKVIGGQLKSFVVSCSQDSKVLMDIFKSCLGNERRPNIIISKFRKQVHDVTKFETRSERYCSLWSILDVSNTVIANTLLDQINVESILLVPTSDEAAELLMDRRTVPQHCKSAYTLNGDQYYPDPNFRVYSGSGITRANYLQVSVEERVRELQRNLESYKLDLRKVNSLLQTKKQELNNFLKEQTQCNEKQKKISRSVEVLRKKLVDLQNKDIPEPPDISQLLDALRETQEGLDQSEEKLKSTVTEYNEILKKYKISEQEIIDERNKKNSLEDKINSAKSKMSNITDTIKFYLEEVAKIKKKITFIETQRAEFEAELNKCQEEIDKKVEVANKFSKRVETQRTIKEISRQFTALSERLKKQEEQQGDILEAAKAFQERKKHYLRVKEEIELNEAIMSKIRESMKMRLRRYNLFLYFNEVYLKSCFKDCLKYRNIDGDLIINYNDQTLTIRMQKKSSSGGSNEDGVLQDLAMMSGGERSFATVCFVLALWDVIDSPFRILDEFDVFMDCVARKQSMELMMKSAKTYNQYIFLTPLDVDNVQNNVHTFVMPDPKRN